MGPALGYALTAPVPSTLLVFTSLGVGMAAPYVVLSVFPAWLRWLPAPGAWMDTFKHVMAFPMFAVVIYLSARVQQLEEMVNELSKGRAYSAREEQ